MRKNKKINGIIVGTAAMVVALTAVVAAGIKTEVKASDVVIDKENTKKDAKEKDSVKSNEEIVKEKVNQIVEYFCKKEYKKVEEAFGKYATDGLVNTLKEIGESCFNSNFKEIIGIKVVEYEKEFDVYVSLDIGYKYHSLIFLFDKELVLWGIVNNTSQPIPEKSDYFVEENIQVGSIEEYQLQGLITLPTNCDNPPVVVLVHGSGFHDADESMGSNRTFAEIAHGLAKQGIATVRYNERFYQYPNLIRLDQDEDGIPDMKCDIYTEAIDDAVAVVDKISKDSRIDSSNIYVAGHSLGGMVAPKIAELNSKVKGIISLAGTPRSLAEVAINQGYLSMETISVEEKIKIWDDIIQLQGVIDFEGKLKQENLKDISDDKKLELLDELLKIYYEYIGDINHGGIEVLGAYTYDYWFSANTLNAKESLNKLDIPMLILQGEDDFQIYADKDYVAWQEILAGRDNCEFKLYDGLNHFFMKSLGGNINNMLDEYLVPCHVDERVIKDMGVFINKYSNKK